MNFPQKVKSTGLCPDLRKQFNMALDILKSLRPLDGHSTQIDRTSSGFFTRTKGSSDVTNKTGGARWL